MAKKNESREFIDVKCTECKKFVIRTEKNKKNTPDKLQVNKFCPVCKKETLFKEGK